MGSSRRVALPCMLTIALMLQAAPVAAATPEPNERALPLTTGPHPSPPTGAELDRLVALNDRAPVDELDGDVTAMVVTHTVHVKIAADEEWRSYYGSNAFTVANNASRQPTARCTPSSGSTY